MTIELHSNGSTQIHLKANTPIESAYLRTMLEMAEKGATVRITQFQSDVRDSEYQDMLEASPRIVISVEQK